MLALQALGTIQASGGAGPRHVLSHPSELHVAQLVEVAHLNRGLQLQAPGGHMSLQGLEPGGRQKRWWTVGRGGDKALRAFHSPVRDPRGAKQRVGESLI